MSNITCKFCGAEQTEAGEIVKPGRTAGEAKQKGKPRGRPFQKRESHAAAPVQKQAPKKHDEEKSIWD